MHADSDQELARFNLKGCRGDALVFAKLYKHGSKWNWMGLGQQGSGRTAAEVAKALALRMVPVNAPPVQAAAPPPTIVHQRPRAAGHARPVHPGDGRPTARVLSVLVPPTSYTWLGHPRQHDGAATSSPRTLSPGQEGARRWC